MKVRASSPIVIELIRGALLLGKFDLQLSWSGWEAEVDERVVKDALEKAAALAGDERLMTVRNDAKPLGRLMLNCFGVERQVEALGELLDLALQNLDKLEGCGEEDAPKLAIMKAEYYENTKTPMMLSDNEVMADALTVALAYAGSVWNLGNVRVGPRDFRAFFLVPVALYSDAIDFLKDARLGKGEKRKRLLPSYATYDWALALWMAVNFDVNGVFRVLYVEGGMNRINVRPSMTIDLAAERAAVEKVFGDRFGDAKDYLISVLNNVLSDGPDPLAIRFTNALYQVAHHSLPAVELKNLGLREFASLLSAKSEIPPVVKQMGRVAQLVKV